MTKEIIRKLYNEKRLQLSQAEYEDLCQQLLLRFQLWDFSNVKYIHMFMPIYKRKEPDTTLMRNWLNSAHPQIRIVYPKTNFADHTMQSFAVDNDLQMGINAFGIPEPISGNEIVVGEIDLILVPLLAFDKQGYRVGYGKGFYDRFMAQCRPDTQFIGLSFFDPVDRITDLNGFDQKMTACITPDKIYTLTP